MTEREGGRKWGGGGGRIDVEQTACSHLFIHTFLSQGKLQEVQLTSSLLFIVLFCHFSCTLLKGKRHRNSEKVRTGGEGGKERGGRGSKVRQRGSERIRRERELTAMGQL